MALIRRFKNSVRLLRRSRFHYYRNAVVTPPFWLWANGRLCRVWAGNEAGAGSCYSEVAVDDCYELFSYARRAKPKVIVDIGANFGIFSKLCSMLFPEAEIYAYEPNPKPFVWLRQNAEGTRIKLHPVAVRESSGLVKLDTSCDSTNSNVRDDGDLPVQCIAGCEIAEGNQIDFLKMDCEGSEWSILKDSSLLRRTKVFSLAYHLHGRPLAGLAQMVEAAGHRVVECVDSGKGGGYGFIRSVLDRQITEQPRIMKAGVALRA